MQKQRNAMSKALKVMAAGTIVFSSLGAVPFNTLASEVIMPAVDTQTTDVKTWNELKVALETANITDINLKADITMAANANINGASKTIHGNGYMINANNKTLSIFAAGTAVKVENMMVVNTHKNGFISGSSETIQATVTLYNIASSGARLFKLSNATLILEGDISDKSTFTWSGSPGSIGAGKIIVRENANVNIETTGADTYAIAAGQELNVEKSSKLNINAKGSSLLMDKGSKGIIDGQITTTAKDINGIRLTQAQLTISKTGVWNALNSGRAGLLLEKSQFENNGLVDINGPKENISGDNSDVTNLGTMKMYSDAALDYNLVRVENGKLTLGTDSHFTFSHKNKITTSSPLRLSVLNVEKGATMEVSANAAKSAVTILETAKFDKGANFSIQNVVGSVLGSFSGASKINIESDNGFATWNKGNVLSKDPNRIYAGPLYMYFEVTGNEANQKQGNLQSDSSEARVFYNNQNTGKIASGSFVKDPRQVEAENKASEAVNSLFTNKDPNGNITSTVTQADIDAAQALIDQVTDSAKKVVLQADLNKAQSQLLQAENNAREAVNNLFANKNPKGNITSTMTQADIDAAQALINKVTDPAKKAELQADLNKAQSQMDAKTAQVEAENKAREAVNDLFTNKNPNGNIMSTMTQAGIDAAQVLINKVTDPTKKAALQADLDKAQNQLDAKTTQAEAENKAREAVNNLFANKDPNGNIAGETTQANIDAVQVLINKVADSAKKAALQADLNKAQSQLDAKTAQAEAENKAREAVNNLFTNKNPNGNITSNMTQADINAAQALINQVTDPAKKAILQADLNKAQSQLDVKTTQVEAENKAREAVNNLFTNKDPNSNISSAVTQTAIDAAQALVNQVTDPAKKAALQKDLNKAKAQFATKGTLKPDEFVLGTTSITGSYSGDVDRITLSKDGVESGNATKTNGTFKFYVGPGVKKDQVLYMVAYDKNGREIAREKVNIAAVTEGNLSPTAMTIPGDSYISGTYTGDVSRIEVSITNEAGVTQLYKGGTVANGTFRFYSFDKTKSPKDIIVVRAYDSVGKLLDTKTVTIKNNVVTTEGKVTPATMTIPGDTSLTGTVSGDVASLKVTVNGTEYAGGSISNGTFKFYTLDKIKKADDNVTIAVYDKTGKLLDSKKVTIQAPTK
ncbi:hypothetical protein BMT55_11480 [Listeria newyorkensis]|uniref:Bacterial Ig domain-containing protein n=1 Tax=Listeria newyorkensis TaxID=1497681 RepID=A0ABX4XLB8_9LIST|nr:toxin Cry1Ac domain D-VI-related protein [Listeria newyorkensis]KGL37810.1 hypothetical protein EP58_16405 [Listeria newyorkensis]PNP90597.1 hypothetical protein BMT55_11480 [Listeria newyorkensis]WAO20423.1 toxin Cry1Ac domain D-VI-related protein [Listeria newyorkensis]SQC56599.1 L-tyrosine decarboxylase [Listeria newyorkensis]